MALSQRSARLTSTRTSQRAVLVRGRTSPGPYCLHCETTAAPPHQRTAAGCPSSPSSPKCAARHSCEICLIIPRLSESSSYGRVCSKKKSAANTAAWQAPIRAKGWRSWLRWPQGSGAHCGSCNSNSHWYNSAPPRLTKAPPLPPALPFSPAAGAIPLAPARAVQSPLGGGRRPVQQRTTAFLLYIRTTAECATSQTT
jgi:hypothetical protein